MARRTREFTVSTVGSRDTGKTFRLTEMPADQGERWATRMMLALANAGAKIPEGVLEAGMSGLAASLPNMVVMGIRSLQGLQYAEVEPLLEEMFGCIQYLPPGGLPAQQIFPGINSQIEEVKTRLQLRYELLELHVGFSLADALTTTAPKAAA